MKVIYGKFFETYPGSFLDLKFSAWPGASGTGMSKFEKDFQG